MMHHHVDRYILLHRALGKKFSAQEKSLHEFADFAGERFAQTLSDLRHRSLSHTVATHGYIRIVILSSSVA
jgi:hypothetical protein